MNCARLRSACLRASVALYVLALTQEAYCTANVVHCWSASRGWMLLLLGWGGLFDPALAHLAWLANPLLFGAWFCILRRHRRYGIALAVAAFACALVFAFSSEVWDRLDDEASRITDLRPGYWLWLASAGLAVAAALSTNAAAQIAEAELHKRVDAAFGEPPTRPSAAIETHDKTAD